MIITLPDWYIEAEEELDKAIEKIGSKNLIDFDFLSDSKGIIHGKELILSRLVRIYEDVNVEQRKRQEEFIKKLKPRKKKLK